MSDQTLMQRLTDRFSKHFWTRIVPLANHLPPKLLARFSGGMDPASFAKLIAQADDQQLEQAMQGPLRTVMLDEIVNRMQDEFVPERANEVDAVFQFNITGGPTGKPDVYQLKVRDNQCATSKGAPEEASVSVEIDAVNFLKMTSGQEKGMNMYLSGRLKMDGAMMLLTRLESMFNIPETPAPAASARRKATASNAS
jgi:putative sterol carrier protein